MSKFIIFCFLSYINNNYHLVPFPENIYFAAAILPDFYTSPSAAKHFSIIDVNFKVGSLLNKTGFLSYPTPTKVESFIYIILLNGFVSFI